MCFGVRWATKLRCGAHLRMASSCRAQRSRHSSSSRPRCSSEVSERERASGGLVHRPGASLPVIGHLERACGAPAVCSCRLRAEKRRCWSGPIPLLQALGHPQSHLSGPRSACLAVRAAVHAVGGVVHQMSCWLLLGGSAGRQITAAAGLGRPHAQMGCLERCSRAVRGLQRATLAALCSVLQRLRVLVMVFRECGAAAMLINIGDLRTANNGQARGRMWWSENCTQRAGVAAAHNGEWRRGASAPGEGCMCFI